MFREKAKRISIRIKKSLLAMKYKVRKGVMTLKAFGRITVTFNKDFPDLTPNENAELVQHYVERLDNLVFSRGDKVKEIAVTAPFSGGKSSFLRTYIKRRPSLLIEVISLAAFKNNSKEIEAQDIDEEQLSDYNAGSSDSAEYKIEKSILQQLLYKTSSSKATYSRFRRIFPQPLGSLKGILFSVWLLSFVVISLAFVTGTLNGGTVIQTLLEYKALSWRRYLSFEFIGAVLTIALPILVLKDSIQFFRSYSLTKLNPLKGEFAFSEKSNDSIFNKYLEEIIYYFAEQKTDIVVFEDLDRFGSTEIFVSLKELNKLVNDSADVKQPVRFIYALKDDIFKGKTRTKFFDSIIPIIPYASSSNSYPQIKNLLENHGFDEDFGDDFLRDISVFLDDMRMIKNIVAEYGIYKDVLIQSSINRDLEKIFAFVVYKNNYSDDFALLNENQGKLADFINSIKKLKDTIKEGVLAEIKNFESEIIQIEDENIEDEDELISLCFRKAFEKSYVKQNSQVQKIINTDISVLFEHKNFMENYESSTQHQFANFDRYHRHQSMTFKAFISNLMPDFEKRLKLIRAKSSDRIQIIENKIREHKQKFTKISQDSIAELCNSHGRNQIFGAFQVDETGDDNRYDLLIHMIERGYIDQHYHLYIYHHRDGVLNSEDMAYLRTIKRGEKVLADYLPTDIPEFIKYLDNHDYSRKAFFNIAIINWMLLTAHGKNTVRLHFRSAYEDELELLGLFTNCRNELENAQLVAWIIFFEIKDFLRKVTISDTADSHVSDFVNDLLVYACDESLPIVNEVSQLKKYISKNKKFIDYASQYKHPSTYLEKLRELKVCFEDIYGSERYQDVMEIVLRERMFDLSFPNFRAILTACFAIKPDSDGSVVLDELFAIDDKTVEIILNNEQSFIADCVINNNLIVKSESVLTTLLTSLTLDSDLKKILVKVIDVHVSNLENIQALGNEKSELLEEIVQSLIAEKKLAHNHNVQTQLLSGMVDIGESYLARYFESIIDADELCEELDIVKIQKLLSILFDNDVTSYAERVIDDLDLEFDEFLIAQSPNEILQKYVFAGRVEMNVSNYLSIYQSAKDIAYVLLSKGYECTDFTSDGINFTQTDFYEVMNGDLPSDFKKFLLENHGHYLTEKEDNAKIIDWVLAYTLDGKQKIIIDYENVKLLIKQISFEQVERRIVFFTTQLSSLNRAEATELLPDIDKDIHSAIDENKRPRVDKFPAMKRMLDILKNKDLISSYTDEFGKYRINPKRK